MRILIAEDERDLNKILSKKLTLDGYAVDSCFDGQEALDYIESAEYDAIILDIMMPRKDGMEVLRTIRAEGNATPVLILTARDAVEDKVSGLDSGASDYLIKPFSFEELAARLRAMLRKSTGAAANTLAIADLVMDCSARTVSRGGVRISLTTKEYALLEYLLRNKNVVLSREKIEDHVWNFDYEGGTNVVDVYIRYLRRKIDEGHPVKLLHTVRGSGYVLREDK